MLGITGVNLVDAEERPVGGKGISALVFYPSTARATVRKDDGLGLQLVNKPKSTGKIIVSAAVDGTGVSGSTIVAVASVGTVEPYFEYVSILCEQFLELCIEILYIERGAIGGLVAIPWREINTEFEAVFLTGCREFSYDIALSVLVRSVADAILGILRRP